MTADELAARLKKLQDVVMCKDIAEAFDYVTEILTNNTHKETTMTNKEAIEVLDTLEISIGAEELREFGFKLTSNRLANLADAVKLAKQALREKADKERRYVVTERYVPSATRVVHRFCVYDIETEAMPAYDIPTREAAQAIADIYEGVKQ